MTHLYLERTTKTPKVNFDPVTGDFNISGRSIPENSIAFYNNLLEWLDEYIKQPNDKTLLTIKLEYFNTSSSKCLVDILRKIEEIYLNGYEAGIKWYYEEEDEDMQESGEDFKEVLKCPMELIGY